MSARRLAAVAALAAIWALPWTLWLGSFPGHMVRHIGLVAVAAPLIVLAWPRLAHRAPPVLLAAVFEFVVVWGFHLPAAHEAARNALPPFLLEQALFLAAGLAVWAGALAPGAALAGAGALLVTSMHMTLLGALLILSPSDLYAAHGHSPDLARQQLGGVLMLAIGTPVYLFAGLALTAGLLRERAA